MANYTSTEDLKKEALHKAGELTDGTSEYNSKAIEYLNLAHLEILSGGNEFKIELGEPWPWAKSKYPITLVLKPKHDTGTITLTQDSTSGTFSNAPTSSLAGWYLKVDGREDYFRIATHTANATAFTIDTEYTGESGSGLSYKAYKLDYDISPSNGLLRLLSPIRVHRYQDGQDHKRNVNIISESEFHENYPLSLIQDGVPTRATIIHHDTDNGTATIRFNKIVGERVKLEIDYIGIPSDLTDSSSSIPLVPRQHRVALCYMAAYWLLVDKEDTKAPEMYQLAQGQLEGLVQGFRKEQAQMSKRTFELTPRPSQTARRYVVQEVD